MKLVIALFLSPLFLQAQNYLTTRPLKYGSTPEVQKLTVKQKKAANIEDFDRAEKQFELEMTFRTRSARIEDDNIRASTAASDIEVGFTYNMTEWLKTEIVSAYTFASGLAATVYGSEGSPASGASVTEGSVSLMPTEGITFSSGIVETEFNPIYSIYGGDALAGFREIFEKKWASGSYINLKSYQAVPTQLGTSNRVLEDDSEAYLILNNVNMGFVSGSTKLEASYSKYDFYNMTRAAADDSKFLGNTMVGEDGSLFRFFRFEYKGQEAALAWTQTFRKDDKFQIRGTVAKNDEAPKSFNTGWLVNTNYKFNFGRYFLKPSFTQFYLESDVMPAFYSTGTFGFLNREGTTMELRGAIKTYNIESYVRFTDSNEIVDTFVQSDRKSLSIGIEVSYEIL